MNLFDIPFLAESFLALCRGIPLTLQLTVLSVSSGALLAILLASFRLSGNQVLDGIARLRQASSDGFDADRAAAEIDGDHGEIAHIQLVETHFIDQKPCQSLVGDLAGNGFRPRHLGEITHAAQ